MLNITSTATQSLYFTLTERLIGSSSAAPKLVLLPKQGTVSRSFQLGADTSTNPMRWNIYEFTGSISGGDYDYRVYSGSLLLESGYCRVDSGSDNVNPVYSKQNTRIVFK